MRRQNDEKHKKRVKALGDPASMTLLQPMPLKSRFFQMQFCSAKRQGQAMAFDVITIY